jgi:hypothetical protein
MIRWSIVRLAFLVVLACSARSVCAGEDAGDAVPVRVVRLSLRENDVTYIPTHPSVTIFIQFPFPISDYSGRGFTEDPQQAAGDFVLRQIDGDNYLIVCPLTETARRTLHVVTGGKGYPLHFFPASASEAWEKITFLVDPSDVPSTSQKAVPQIARTTKPPRKNYERPGTARVIGMIDMLRMLANMPEKQARGVVTANSALSFSIKNQAQKHEGFSITTQFVVRNQLLDSLGFAVTLENTGRQPLDFAPDSFSIRAGAHVYHAAAADLDPHLEPHGKTTAFFVVVGDGTGGANHLSSENDFRVSIDLAGRPAELPVTELAMPAPALSESEGSRRER